MLKKLLIALLAVGTLTLGASAAFVKTETYADGTFHDIPSTEWYAAEVAGAYELGLMNGVGANLFDPNGSVTVAEAITMAARAHALYLNEAIPDASGEWYAKYVSYAKTAGITADEFAAADFDRPATRSEVAELFRKSMTADWFSAVNAVSDIPDVPENAACRDGLLLLYNAGIVMGSDAVGTFNPDAAITRAEAAAIINRVALPEKRLHKTLDKISYSDAYLLAQNDSMASEKEGIASGWLLDNRGGIPRTSLTEGYGTLYDRDTEAGVAYIREFNKFSTGSVVLDTSLTAKGDGIYLEFRNDSGDAVYRAEIKDGAWQVLGSDGSYTKLCDIEDETEFSFYVTVDLDNLRSTTFINAKDCGTYPLSVPKDKANILNFRFATTEKATGILTPGRTEMFVNYAVNDNFLQDAKDALPFDWTGDAVTSDHALKLNKGVSGKCFGAVSGNVVAAFEMLLPKNENVSYTLTHDGAAVAVFEAKDGVFSVNGTQVYTDAVANLWYRLRFELDTASKTILVKVNGRKTETVPFASAASSVSALSVENKADTAVYFDNFRVYRTFEHDDYVPTPVKPAGEENYLVGMNVCPLWQNGKHYGWSCITPYDDIKPVLGYYDESRPETADWEIKYLIEHGIDFQAFCVFFTQKNGSVCLNNDGYPHLYEGFMNAKYADMTKFCGILETANAASASTLEEWKNAYVPYIIENLIKDERYLVIDNKPLIMVFGADAIKRRAGSTENARAMFDYLEEELKKLGYDGAIYLAAVVPGSNVNECEALGYDGMFAYNWGTNGYSLGENKSWNLSFGKRTDVYHVPTVSVGFNNVGWAGTRRPLMSLSDYKSALTWVRDEYLPEHAKDTWQKNFMLLSTWNEYGEGTYIMPTADEKGFGYLDAVREVYTDEKADASVNTVPTETQKERINHLYSQYRRLLRREGFYVSAAELTDETLETVYAIDLSKLSADDYAVANLNDVFQDENGLTGTAENGDPNISLKASYITPLNLDLSGIDALRLTAKIPTGTVFQIFYKTSEEGSLDENKSVYVRSGSDDFETVIIDMTNAKKWSGTLTGIRLDPGSVKDSAVSVKSLEFMAKPRANESNIGTDTIYINGFDVKMTLPSEKASDGDILVAFDQTIGLDFRLNAFAEWSKADGTLKLNFKKHTVVFTVGDDTYTVDGAAKKLPYKIHTTDGLPMLPMKALSDAVGFTYSVNEIGDVLIETPEKAYYDELAATRKDGAWEFNTPGDIEGWTSSEMKLAVDEGYMACESLDQNKDPKIRFKKTLSLVANKYASMEIRVRYKYTSKGPHTMTMYFSTDKAPGMNENKTIYLPLKSNDSGGEWEIYTVDLKENKNWSDTITGLRFDPFNTYGQIDIDYIRFIEDPDFDEEAEARRIAEEEAARLAAEEAERARGAYITNGDAEGEEVGFTSGNGVVSIVEDPTNSKNHCYLFMPKDDGKVWLYSNHKEYWTPGKTYKVSLDAMIASHGLNTELPTSFKAALIPNIRFKDPEKGVDHGQGGSVIAAYAGKWTHAEFEFTVPERTTDRSGDEFCIYADPIQDKGIGFYLDNITLTAVE